MYQGGHGHQPSVITVNVGDAVDVIHESDGNYIVPREVDCHRGKKFWKSAAAENAAGAARRLLHPRGNGKKNPGVYSRVARV